jgi:hypothetical protein
MEGVIDHTMRDLLTRLGGIDRCVTEFLRVSHELLPPRVFYRICPELRQRRMHAAGTPVYLQLLGGIAAAPGGERGARGGAGRAGHRSELRLPGKNRQPLRRRLRDPARAGARARDRQPCAPPCPRTVPLTVKIRLGFDDRSRFLDVVAAIDAAAPTELIIHARTRADGYRPPAYWEQIARAREVTTLPLVANGEIWSVEDARAPARERQRKTSCSAAARSAGRTCRVCCGARPADQQRALTWPAVLDLLRRYLELTLAALRRALRAEPDQAVAGLPASLLSPGRGALCPGQAPAHPRRTCSERCRRRIRRAPSPREQGPDNKPGNDGVIRDCDSPRNGGPRLLRASPKGLLICFATELWERFSFYGMKYLLLLYLTKYHLFTDSEGLEVLGAYAALVYAMPVIGGLLADRYLGMRKAVVFGGLLLVLGHLGMAVEGEQARLVGDTIVRDGGALQVFYASLALIVIGVGFLKPNISTIVGQLYGTDDPRRDAGFTIFYMGINLGAFSATLLCGWLGETLGWAYGFGAAGIGMLLGLATFIYGQRYLRGLAEPPEGAELGRRTAIGLNREWSIYAGAVVAVAVIWQMLQFHAAVGLLLNGLSLAVLAGPRLVHRLSL